MKLADLYFDNAAYVMIGVGVLILLVALGGFYCTAKDKIAPLYMVTTCYNMTFTMWICNLYPLYQHIMPEIVVQ